MAILQRWQGMVSKSIIQMEVGKGTDKEKTIFWLSIWDGFFKVSLYFAEKLQPDMQSLAVSENTKVMIDNTKIMGKLKFFPLVYEVRSSDIFEDLSILIEYKKDKG